jgi:hypothetical protein
MVKEISAVYEMLINRHQERIARFNKRHSGNRAEALESAAT